MESKNKQDLDRLRKAYRVITGLEEILQETRKTSKANGGSVYMEPIAITGMSCRFSGDAESPEGFWELLKEGRNTITDVPEGRWYGEDSYDPSPEAINSTFTKKGGFLKDVDSFDSLFFNISPREAEAMDPQQRIFLEECWKAFEDAGYGDIYLNSSRCGVYGGVYNHDYDEALSRLPHKIGSYELGGNQGSMLPARISYHLNLRGASIGINTACSSSLVALDLACKAIQNGELDIALAGGVFLFLTSRMYVLMSQAQTLSPDGQCKAFDNDADGFVPGEGAGVVVLKSLRQARLDGDRICGVIIGSGCNQDGKSNGITAPNAQAQADLESEIYAKYDIDPYSISYVEAHGTGTKLGDPIEVEALTQAFRKTTREKQFCALGSVKTNVGHTQAAAGMAGLIKVLLALRYEEIPASINCRNYNEHIDFENSPFFVSVRPAEWKRDKRRPRRAAISSFGFSGTNAHVVLQEAPEYAAPSGVESTFPYYIIPFSAKSRESLTNKVADFSAYLNNRSVEDGLADIAFTLCVGRSHFQYREVLLVGTIDELRTQVNDLHQRMENGEISSQPSGKEEDADRSLNLVKELNQNGGDVLLEKMKELAALYRRGVAVDWEKLFEGKVGRRISLPTYPFEKKPHRIQADASVPLLNGDVIEKDAQIHPLIHRNLSTFEEQKFLTLLRGDEYFLTEHLVAGRKTLPGTAYLEMAYAAIKNSTGLKNAGYSIRNIVWERPLVWQQEDVRLFTALQSEEDRIKFRIYSKKEGAPELIHAEGDLVSRIGDVVSREPSKYDLDAIRSRCPMHEDAETVYDRFRKNGIIYGPRFRIVRNINRGRTECLSVFRLGEEDCSELDQFVLHPILFDGALQAIIGMFYENEEKIEQIYPFSAAKIELHAPLSRAGYSYVKEVKNSSGTGRRVRLFQVLILDEQGRILAEVEDFAIRVLSAKDAAEEDAAPEPASIVAYTSSWETEELLSSPDTSIRGPVLVLDRDGELAVTLRKFETDRHPDLSVILVTPGKQFKKVGEFDYQCDPEKKDDLVRLFDELKGTNNFPVRIFYAWGAPNFETAAEGPNVQYETAVLSVFFCIQALLATRPSAAISFEYLFRSRETEPYHEAMAALLRTAKSENPLLNFKVLGFDADMTHLEIIAALIRESGKGKRAFEVRYRKGARHIRRCHPAELNQPGKEPGLSFRKGGTYLITGGLGGMGLLFAEHLAKRYSANLVLVGRGGPDPEQEKKIRELERSGGSVLCLQKDITKAQDVEELLHLARKKYGVLHGILHTAGVLRDSFILKKSAVGFSAVIAPKIQGALLLDQFTQKDKLDIFVLFSSIAALMGNPGQADYAYGNRFMDHFARLRSKQVKLRKRFGKTVSINWAMMETSGMEAGKNSVEYLRNNLGIAPMPESEILLGLDYALAASVNHFLIFSGNQKLAGPFLEQQCYFLDDAPRVTQKSEAIQEKQLLIKVERYLKKILGTEVKMSADRIQEQAPLEGYGLDSFVIQNLNRILEKKFGDLPKTIFFEYRTITDLAEYLLESHREQVVHGFGDLEKPESKPDVSEKKAQPRKLAPVLRKPDTDDIAIVGISGRYPMADELEDFWTIIKEGKDCITEIPDNRWDHSQYFDSDPEAEGKTYSKWGGFLKDVTKFDPLFFRITPKEAEFMDPQERIFLETVWRTAENAGYARESLRKYMVGVFVGVMYGHYQLFGTGKTDKGETLVPGASFSAIANRVSHFFDFRGPSMAVDTMCSSSLTALHLACESLRRGEIEAAFAGGINLTVHPNKYVEMSQGRFTSADGRCRSFGEGGDGYVPGEGAGAVLLKPLASAESDRDFIHGVIKATALNHGGKTNGFTVPDPAAQSTLLKKALEKSQVPVESIGYIEAHGTGTALGDPIEVKGLEDSLGILAPAGYRCPIGSVKSNIGHLESAAGIAGVTKVLLQMKHKLLAPSLHSAKLNKNIAFESSPFFVQQEPEEWKRTNHPRRAGVSSFGAGGSNAHVILEEYENHKKFDTATLEKPRLFVLSAATRKQLNESVGRIIRTLEKDSPDMYAMTYTLQVGRAPLESRLAVIADDVSELKEKLEFFIRKRTTGEGIFQGESENNHRSRETLEQNHEIVKDLIQNRNWSELGRLWVGGARVDWMRLYSEPLPSRIPLPTAVFHGERYWLPDRLSHAGRTETKIKQKLIVLENTSNFREQKYISSFTGDEFFLQDHRIRGERILPAAVYLELGVQAGRLAMGNVVIGLSGISWTRPIVFANKELICEIKASPLDNGGASYEIFILDDQGERGSLNGEGKITFEKQADAKSAEDQVDPDEIRGRCLETVSSDDFYEKLESKRMSYGNRLRGVVEIRKGPGEALASLRLPESLKSGFRNYHLHPSLVDSALQAVSVLLPGEEKSLFFPAKIEEIEFKSPLTEELLVHIRQDDASFSNSDERHFTLQFLDASGKQLMCFRRYTVKKAGETNTRKKAEVLYFEPSWEEKEFLDSQTQDSECRTWVFASDLETVDALEKRVAPPLQSKYIWIIPGNSFEKISSNRVRICPDQQRDYEELFNIFHKDAEKINFLFLWPFNSLNYDSLKPEEELRLGFSALFNLSKAILVRYAEQGTLLYAFAVDDGTAPFHEGVGPFLRTLTQENPKLKGKLINLQGQSLLDSFLDLIREMNSGEGDIVRLERGKRQTQTYKETKPSMVGSPPQKDPFLKNGGTYLITGGAGALGRIFARYFAEMANVNIVMLGRSDLNSELQNQIEVLNRSGSNAIYMQTDLSSLESLEVAIQEIKKRFKEINGILHCAGVIRDSLLLRKTWEEVEAVLAPKIKGTVFLDALTRSEPLDFLVLFSSVTGAIGNIGQADYAYANGFLDSFSRHREELRAQNLRSGKTLSLNWPLWEAGGMNLDAGEKTLLWEERGMVPLTTEEGIRALSFGLSRDVAQFMVLAGDWKKLTDQVNFKPVKTVMYETPDFEVDFEKFMKFLKTILSSESRVPVDKIREDRILEDYGISSVMIVTMTKVLEKDFGSLSKTLFFEYRTLSELARYFIKNHKDALYRKFSKGENGARQRTVAEKSVKDIQSRFVAAPVKNPANPAREIAIVGLSGQYPKAKNLHEFWENLKTGRDCVTKVPAERWISEERHQGGFLDTVADFDPLFFNISPKDAELMDPQERLFLQSVWHTLEDAGYTGSDFDGKSTGVFVGVMWGQYQLYGREGKVAGDSVIPNSSYGSIANRVSYFLNLTGPSFALDSMCSSSLTAIHLAAESIKRGECTTAIAGGVNLSIHPNKYMQLSRGGFLSSDGRCRSFGSGGDGYVPGEGVGAVLLKPLREAVADRDYIYGVIKGSSINHGGKTNGYTVPNPNAQGRLIRDALKKSGVEADAITCIEAHGTGTALGDPIELTGLVQGFGEMRDSRPDCALGSVKSNIGHLEAAAGIAGLTKVLLQMKHKTLVPSLHSETLNPNLDFSNTPFKIPRTSTAWETPGDIPRRAGVSSFGAGGANVHLIVEEFPESSIEEDNTDEPDAVLFVLSAQNRKALLRYAGLIAEHLESFDRAPSYQLRLVDVVFTFQKRRSVMDERLACVVRDLNELREKLNQFAAGSLDIDDFYTGNVASEESSSLFKGKTGKRIFDVLLEEKEFTKIGELWVRERNLDLSRLSQGAGRKVSLPVYPFDEKRFWFSGAGEYHGASRLHPLLDKISPELSFQKGLVFETKISDSKPVVEQHRVKGRSVLPGVAYLEMALAAVRQIAPDQAYQIRRIEWLNPAKAEDGSLALRLSLQQEEGALNYRIYSESGEVTYSQGELVEATEESEVRETAIKPFIAGARHIWEGEPLYEGFKKPGIHYGPYFQTVKDIWVKGNQALGRLSLDQSFLHEMQEYTLHPAIMDGAIQTLAAFVPSLDRLRLPFSADSLKIIRPLTSEAYAFAEQEREGYYHIAVLDSKGRLCVKLNGIVLRDFKDPLSNVFFAPVWEAGPLGLTDEKSKNNPDDRRKIVLIYPENNPGMGEDLGAFFNENYVYRLLLGHRNRRIDERTREINVFDPDALENFLKSLPHIDCIYFLGGIQDAEIKEQKELELSQEQGVVSFFRLIKTISHNGLAADAPGIRVITNNVYAVTTGEKSLPYAAGIFGIARVVAKEHSELRVSCYDLDGAEILRARERGQLAESLEAICGNAGQASGNVLAIREGRSYRQNLHPLSMALENGIQFKENGVYLILGGAGGIGLELSRYLAKNYRARLVLIGRRRLDEGKEKFIEEIKGSGGDAFYIQADASKPESIQKAVRRGVSRFRALHGVIHSAIELDDRTLKNMDEESLKRVLSPKVYGSFNLFQAVKNEKLDFMLFFSSAQAFAGSAGQANYCAASCFEDAFASSLTETAPFPVKTINWGYWGSVGIVATEEHNQRLARRGVQSISSEEGMEMIAKVLAGRLPQVLAVKAERRALKDMRIDFERPLIIHNDRPAERTGKLLETFRRPSIDSGIVTRIQCSFAELQGFARLALLRNFQEWGLFKSAGEAYSYTELSQRLEIIPEYDGLFRVTLQILERQGWLEQTGVQFRATEKMGRLELREKLSLIEQQKEEFLKSSDVGPHIPLLWNCLGALKDVQAGRVHHLNVMFPDGSKKLVESVYQGNELADYYNRLLAELVRHFVKERLAAGQDSPIRILEVGAGTGATSRFVLESLRGFASNVFYSYTDISSGFMKHGESVFGETFPFAEFRTLDLEGDPQEQGFQVDYYDLIFGSNVIHATKNISHTLDRIKRLLKARGLFLMNEITRIQDVASLTFGLTGGWWLFEDSFNRLPGSPLIGPGRWRGLLEEKGFNDVSLLGLPHVEEPVLEQCVILGESDGLVLNAVTKSEIKAAVPTNVSIDRPARNESRPDERRESDSDELEDKTQDYIAGIFAEYLKLDKADFQPHKTYERYGIDSLVIVEVTKRLNNVFGDIPSTLLFENITIHELGKYLLKKKRKKLLELLGPLGEGDLKPARLPEGYKPDSVAAAPHEKIFKEEIITDQYSEKTADDSGDEADEERQEMLEVLEQLSNREIDNLLEKLVK